MIENSEILNILRPYPKAIALYNEVRTFYNNALVIRRLPASARYSQSDFIFDSAGEFRSARSQIVTESPRAAAAFAHEMLHLVQPAHGFPIKYKVFYSSEWVRQYCVSLVDEVLNAIHHEMFFREFLNLDLAAEDFLASSQEPDLNIEAKEIDEWLKRGCPSEIRQAMANATYLRFWITNRHAPNNYFSERYLAMMAGFWPSAHSVATAMRHWIERDDFREPSKYADSINWIFSRVGLPTVEFRPLMQTSAGLRLGPL